MRCLNDVELQAVADGEAEERARAHGAECPRCRPRVDRIRARIREIGAIVNAAGDAPGLEARISEAIASRGAVRGATTLRVPNIVPPWRQPRLVLPVATAAMLMLVVSGMVPWFGSPASLSASQVLGRSLATLQKGEGIEMLQYELVTSGIFQGSWRIDLMIDHERPTRYRVTTLSPGGEVVAAFSQDPVRQQRSQLTRVDGRNYIVTVSPIRQPVLSLPQMAQSMIETSIAMMQATADQKLTIAEGSDGREYVVEIPPVAPIATTATLELHRARVAVDADDFRIRTFRASGALLRQPFDVSFRLLRHATAVDGGPMITGPDAQRAPADLFDIVPEQGDIVLEGIAADHPFEELVTTLIRELARNRAF